MRVIPAEALNCPSCGKERKELNDLRTQCRTFKIASVICTITFIFLPAEYILLRILLVGALLLGGYFMLIGSMRHYKSISGKDMAGW